MRFRQWRGMAAAAGLGAALLVTIDAAPASAAPNFKAPFPCGQRWTYSHHSAEVRLALDFVRADGGTTDGTPNVASAAGTASRHYQAGGAGNYIVLDHGGGWKTYYFHLSSFSVANGQVVAQGQQIGVTGSTGNSSGPHIHYEQLHNGVGQTIHINGASLAPYPGSYHQKYLTSDNCGTPAVNEWGTQFADIDGDGRDEVIAVAGNGDVVAWRNTGGFAGANQTYTAGATLIARGFTAAERVRFADIDGDGRDEIVAIDPDGQVGAWRNVGGFAGANQTYIAGRTLIAAGFTVAGRVRFADIDTGGGADIATTGDTNFAWRNAGGLAGSNQTYTVGSTIIAYGFQ